MVGRVKIEVWNEKRQYWASALCKRELLETNIWRLLRYGFAVRAAGLTYWPPGMEQAA